MKALINRITQNPFIKTITAGGITQGIMIASSFVVNKIIAVMIGPSGTMLYGQFNNLFNIVTNFSVLFSEQGIIKLVSENKTDVDNIKSIFSTTFLILFITSFIGGLAFIIFSSSLNDIFFNGNNFINELIFFGLSIIFIGLNRFAFAILNAFNEIRKISFVRIFQSVLTLFLTSYFCWIYGLSGLIISVTISQFLIFLFNLYILNKTNWFEIKYFLNKINLDYLKKIMKFSLMGFTATFSTLIYIKIRSLLTINFDANTAGLWDGMLKISGGYLAVITSAISLYYLPKLSSIKKEKEIKKEIFNGFKVLLPLMFIISFSLFLFKRPIISLFFSSEYINMSDFFFPQLLGDFIRITSQCIAYLMIAKAMTKLFIYTEIYFAIQYLILVWLCIDHFGLIGVFWAYTINSFIYLIFLIFKFKKYLI